MHNGSMHNGSGTPAKPYVGMLWHDPITGNMKTCVGECSGCTEGIWKTLILYEDGSSYTHGVLCSGVINLSNVNSHIYHELKLLL